MSCLPIKWTQKDIEIRNQYRRDAENRRTMDREQANKIPPDFDEFAEKINSPYLFLPLQYVWQDPSETIKLLRPRKPISIKLRRTLIKSRGIECELCKNHRYDQIHHMDGNPSNNDPSNLQLLCYDCHMQIEGKIRFV
jgi:5-methylcytosine-specific restriction endonuclease McrA